MARLLERRPCVRHVGGDHEVCLVLCVQLWALAIGAMVYEPRRRPIRPPTEEETRAMDRYWRVIDELAPRWAQLDEDRRDREGYRNAGIAKAKKARRVL